MKKLHLLAISLLVVTSGALQAACCGMPCTGEGKKAVKRVLRSELGRCAECGGDQEEVAVDENATKCNCGKPANRKCSSCGKCSTSCSTCCKKDMPRRNMEELRCDSCGGETQEVQADENATKCNCGKPVNRKCSSCGKCCTSCSSCCSSCK